MKNLLSENNKLHLTCTAERRACTVGSPLHHTRVETVEMNTKRQIIQTVMTNNRKAVFTCHLLRPDIQIRQFRVIKSTPFSNLLLTSMKKPNETASAF